MATAAKRPGNGGGISGRNSSRLPTAYSPPTAASDSTGIIVQLVMRMVAIRKQTVPKIG